MRYDVLIIGAGLSGLAAGVRLARSGKKVLLVEAHTMPGGMNSYYNHAGRTIDVGLHAMTHYTEARNRQAPLNKLLRRLGLHHHQLDLAEQIQSRIKFPGSELRFTNDPADLAASIGTAFPDQAEGFARLDRMIRDYDRSHPEDGVPAADEVLQACLTNPLLVNMLKMPLLHYGAASGDNLNFHDLAVRWKSMYHEGLSRPEGGMQRLIALLSDRFHEAGGTLLLGQPVLGLQIEDHRVTAVRLAGGKTEEAACVISSAGYVETMRLCSNQPADALTDEIGKLSFVEFIGFLDILPAEIGITDSVLFFSSKEAPDFACPFDLADFSSGMICFPNNFRYHHPPREGMVRVTLRANHEHWARLKDRDAYREAKVQVMARLLRETVRKVQDFRPHLTYYELYTPTTIARFTRRLHGAVNGSLSKHWDGTTEIENLFICGTDQGLNGIVGAMFSGVLMANLHGLGK